MCSNTIALTARKPGQVSLEQTVTMADHKLSQILDGYDKRPSTFQLAMVVHIYCMVLAQFLATLRGENDAVPETAVDDPEIAKNVWHKVVTGGSVGQTQ